MKINSLKIQGVLVIQPRVFGDACGFFMESWNKRELNRMGFDVDIVQDNHSKSSKGVLRGIHFQTQHSQGKLVRVIRGEVFDVAVDLRKDSPTFGQHESVILSEENKMMFYIPPNFGHAYLALSDEVEFLCKTTDYYYPEYDSDIIWNDPTINIQWPLKEYGIEQPLLSEKDMRLKRFDELF